MRGLRDGVEVDCDLSDVPADRGLPAREAIANADRAGVIRSLVRRPKQLDLPLIAVLAFEPLARPPTPGGSSGGPPWSISSKPHERGAVSAWTPSVETTIRVGGASRSR